MSRRAKDSKGRRRLREIVRFSLTPIIIAFFSAGAFASPLQEGTPTIDNIVWKIDGNVSERNAEDLISLKKGDVYSLKKIDQSLKQIFQTDLFSDVRVLKSGGDRVELTFVLTHWLNVRNITYVGEKNLPYEIMKKGVEALQKGGHYSEERENRAVAELDDILRQEGYFDPVIKTDIRKDVIASAADVSFIIESYKKYVIGKIGFEGHLLVPEGDLRKRMKSREGVPYIPSRFGQDLQKIKDYYYSLGYQRAELKSAREEFDRELGRVDLMIDVLPFERTSLIVKGAKVPAKLLAPIWEEHVFEEWALAEGESLILAYLRKKGYLFASLKAGIERRENETRLVYEVNPGGKFRVSRVIFEGQVSFSASRIKSEVGIGEKIPIFALMSGKRLFEIPAEIELFYRMNGFPECRVELNLKSRGKAATAVFIIKEGQQQKIDRVVLRGVSLFPMEQILAGISSAEGRPFFSPNVQKDIEKIEVFYLDRGVRGTKVTSEVQESSPGKFTVFLTVSEGLSVRVGDIIVSGNRETQKKIILRELLVHRGEEASWRRILETKRRLEALGVFSEVKIEEMPTSPNQENLIINVKEGQRYSVSAGVGLETKNEPRSLAIWENGNIRPRGTAEFIRSNMFGMASQLSLVGQLSLVEKRAVVSWEQRYFFGIPMSTYLNGWIEEEKLKSFGFDRRGVSLNAIKPLSSGLAFLGTISFSRTKLTYLHISESEVGRQRLPYSTALLSGSLIWDRRDDTFNPSRGLFLSFVGEWAYPVFKTESDYLKSFVKFQYFSPILTRMNFSATFRLGLGRGKIPVPERFFAGGSNSFRGEAFDELGPKDQPSNFPVGGKSLFLMNLEMKFPLIPNLSDLSGAVFYDAGQVFSQRKDFSLFNLEGALGVGLRYRTPLGPLRFDVGWNVNDRKNRGRPHVFITIGNMF